MNTSTRLMKLALLADTSQFSKGLKTATNQTMSFGDKVKGIAKGIGLAFLGASAALAGFAVNLGMDAIKSASNFEESLNKVNVIFGKNAKSIEAWAKTGADAFGQSQTQAMDAASQFATFGKAAGLQGPKLAAFSKKLVVLATDLASFDNTSVEEAIQAIGAGLRGESEPMRKYGVLLNDNALKAYAFANKLYSGKGALDMSSKVLSAYGEILAQTTYKQGDFLDTQDSTANTLKRLDAAWENIKTTIGKALLPAFQNFTNWLVKTGVPGLETFIDVMQGKSGKTLQQAILGGKTDMNGFTYGAMSENQTAWVNLADSVKGMATAFGTLFTKLEIDNPEGSFNKMIDGLGTAADFMGTIATGIGYIGDGAKGLVTLLTGGGADFSGNDGKRAMGGYVRSGGSYLVGERGPELFTPNGAGNITPNHRMGGGVTVNVYGAADARESARAISRTLAKLNLNGGTAAGVVGFA